MLTNGGAERAKEIHFYTLVSTILIIPCTATGSRVQSAQLDPDPRRKDFGGASQRQKESYTRFLAVDPEWARKAGERDNLSLYKELQKKPCVQMPSANPLQRACVMVMGWALTRRRARLCTPL